MANLKDRKTVVAELTELEIDFDPTAGIKELRLLLSEATEETETETETEDEQDEQDEQDEEDEETEEDVQEEVKEGVSKVATVNWRGRNREYSFDRHGGDYKKLAKSFSDKIGGTIDFS